MNCNPSDWKTWKTPTPENDIDDNDDNDGDDHYDDDKLQPIGPEEREDANAGK